MSFSGDIKTEILENKAMAKNFYIQIALGMLSGCQTLNSDTFSFVSNQKEITVFLIRLVNRAFNTNYKFEITKTQKAETLFELRLENENDIKSFHKNYIDLMSADFSRPEQKGSFVSGAFLACGSASDPENSYHLEFVLPKGNPNSPIKLFLLEFCPLRETSRRGGSVLYCKDAGQISDILAMMNTGNSALKLINAEIYKEVRNNANRVTNFETANIDKTVVASTNQVEDINLVLKTLGPENIKDTLVETARIRIENPYSSLRELAEMFSPPISRSGLHHRLSALSRLAQEIRDRKQEGTNV